MYQAAANGRRWSNRAVARLVLFVMAVMAVIGLSYAWVTKEARRERDQLGQPSRSELPPIQPVAPAKLEALGYLPADTNVILGIHVAEWISDAARQDLLARVRSDAVNLDINNLEPSTGLRLEEIDHAVLGIHLSSGEPISITLVVQTRQPYDAKKVLSTLQAKRDGQDGERTLYRCDRFPFLWLWRAGDRILVFRFLTDDFKAVPLEPEPGVDRFISPLSKLLEAMKESTPVWAVGHASDWGSILNQIGLMAAVWQLRLPELPMEDKEALAKVQTFGAWLEVSSEGLQGTLKVKCADSAGARRLDEYLSRSRLLARLSRQPHAQALTEELSTSLKHSPPEDGWVAIQAEAKLQSILQVMAGGR